MADNNADQQRAIPPKAVPPVPAAGGASAPRTVRMKPVGEGGVPIAPSAPAGTAAAAEAIKRMTTRIDAVSNEAGTANPAAPRVQLSATARIPDLPDLPKTIKIRPLEGSSGTSAEPPPSFGQPLSQQPAGKSKTSRIPLDSAMVVPQGESPSNASKTIKLKRPDEMSPIKVSVPGAGEQETDNAAISQKKTIRVKRPIPTAAVSGPADEAGAPSMAAISPLEFVSVEPERGMGMYIALAVVGIILIIGLAGLFSVQLFGWPIHSALDAQFQKG